MHGVNVGVVAEAHKGDGVATLTGEIQPVEDAQRPVPAPERPHRVGRGVIEGGLQVREPFLVASGQVALPAGGRGGHDRFQLEPPAPVDGLVEHTGPERPRRGYQRRARART